MMRDTKFLKELVELLILTAPIRLEGKYFAVKLTFNECLKVTKNLEHVGTFFEEINPRIFAIIIYEAHIICVSTNRGWGRPPHIRKNKLQWFG